MQIKHLAHLCLFTWFAVTSSSAIADVIKSDDLIVQGRQCVGFDCVNNMDFAADTLVLRENNLRIRLHDTSAADVIGQSWNLSANNSVNGGRSYFQFELKSLTKDTVQFSDGSAALYDCTVPVATPNATLVPIIGVIPEGEPIRIPGNPAPDGMGMWIFECVTVDWWTELPILTLATAAEGSVTLGRGSRTQAGAVSVGDTGLLRKLQHVAAGIADTDVLIRKTMTDYSTLQDQKLQAEFLQARLAVLESQISTVEDEVFPSKRGGGYFSLYFMLWLSIAAGLLRLIRWHESAGQDRIA